MTLPSNSSVMEKVSSLESFHGLLGNILEAIFSSSPDSRVFVLPISLVGLANRLRIMGSFVGATTLYRAHLIVPWFRDLSCNHNFHELFALNSSSLPFNISIIDVDLGSRGELDVELLQTELNDGLLQFLGNPKFTTSTAYNNTLTHFLWSTVIPTSFYLPVEWFRPSIAKSSVSNDLMISNHRLYIRTRGAHALNGQSCREYLQGKRLLYQAISPGPRIKELYDTIFLQYFAPTHLSYRLIGVHLRSHDVHHDWAMISPLARHNQNGISKHASSHPHLDSAETFSTIVGPSPVSSIISLLKRMSASVDNETKIKFFLVSNNQVWKQELVDGLGDDNVISLLFSPSLSKELGPDDELSQRDHPLNVEMAAIEFLLLSETHSIWHTHGSSFAREAGIRRQRPVMDIFYDDSVKDVVLFLSALDDDRLPQCSMPEFIRHQHLQSETDLPVASAVSLAEVASEKTCFVEDGGRVMCSLRYPICPCPSELHLPFHHIPPYTSLSSCMNNNNPTIAAVEQPEYDKHNEYQEVSAGTEREPVAKDCKSVSIPIYCPVIQGSMDTTLVQSYGDQNHHNHHSSYPTKSTSCLEIVAESQGFSL